MPNDDLRMNSVMSAHAAYVRDEEVRLGVTSSSYELGAGRLPDEDKARYGNRLLGAKADRVLHPDIGSLPYFRRTLNEDHNDGRYTIRRWLPVGKCSVCKKIKDKGRLENNSSARKEIQIAYDNHLCEVKLGRQHYYSNRLRA